MEPIAALSRDDAARVVGVVFDLDDTLTRDGVIEREAFDALCALRDAGLSRVLVTGRPLGIADTLARVLPIDAACGENGAGWHWRDARGAPHEGYAVDAAGWERERAVLERIRERVARELPDVRIADDQALRRRDLAYDVGERVVLPPERVAALVALIESEGARALVSSVHAHAQASGYDKGTGALAAIRDALGDARADASRWLFVGDSGNDAAAFARFPLSAAPSNVRAHLGRLPVPPRFVADADRGRGFAEIVAALLAWR